MNVTLPSMKITITYGAVTSFIGFVDIYLLIALSMYEVFYPKKPKGGKKLRIICLVAVSVAIFHEILQQLILTIADKSDTNCFALMLLKSTVLSIVVSLSYAFLWLKQHSIYSNPRLKHLWGEKMRMIEWIILGVLAINPVLMFGVQFIGDWYVMVDGVCIVKKINQTTGILLGILCFSYSVIQVGLHSFL